MATPITGDVTLKLEAINVHSLDMQSNNQTKSIRAIVNASHKDDLNENCDFEIRKMQKEYTDRIYNELLNEIKETITDKSNTTNNFKYPERSDLAKKKKRSN